MSTIMTNDMGSIFLQPAGPNGTQFWLGCHDLGDISIPEGDISRDYCPDPTGRGKWKIMTRSQGMGGEITVDVTFPLGQTADYLEEMIQGGRRCPVGLYVNWNQCGARNWPQYYDRGFVLENAIMTARTFTNSAMANRDGSAPTSAMRTFSFSGEEVVEYYNLVATDRAHAGAAVVKAIAACSPDQCLGACGEPSYLGQTIYCTIAALAGAEAAMYVSNDFGVTWGLVPGGAAIMPWAVAENVAGLVCFPINPTTTRILVARTSTTAATPAQVAYSDDGGTTFSAAVAVGATNTEFFSDHQQCLQALSRESIWGVTDTGAGASGNVYHSTDGGVTWVAMMTGAADSLNVVNFADENTGVTFGNTGQCYTTVDAGVHWTTRTVVTGGPAIRGCLCLDAYRFWASTAAGTMYYTQDGGVTWTARAMPLPTGATAITQLSAMDKYDDYVFTVVGIVTIGGNPFGAIWRTWDGGANWTSVTTPVTYAQGMIAVDMITVNNIFGGGGVTATDAVILQAAMS